MSSHSTTLTPTVYEEMSCLIRNFCAATTLRALPRLSRSKTLKLRLFWLLVFIGLLGGAILCVYLIVSNYLTFTTIVIKSVISNVPSPFPSITVCAHRPLTNDGLMLLGGFTPNFFARLYEFQRYQHEIAHNASHPYEIPYPTLAQFYQILLRWQNVAPFSRAKDTFLFDCMANVGSKKMITGVNDWIWCSPKTDFTIEKVQVQHAKYMNCYMLTFTKDFINSATSLQLILNLQNYHHRTVGQHDIFGCKQCMQWTPETWRTGARIFIHQPRTWFPDRDFVDVSAASINDVTFTTVQKTYLEGEHGSCSKHHADQYIEDKGYNYTYTADACIKKMIQDAIRKKCNCSDPTLPLSDSNHLTFCEGFINDQTKDNYLCMTSVKETFDLAQAKKVCLYKCVSYSYKKQVSSTLGIHPSMYLFLYKTLRNAKQPLASMEKVEMAYKAGNYQLAYDYLDDATNFKNSFTVFTITRSNFDIEVRKQEQQTDLPGVLSMVGGLSSFFIGFSVFIIFELIELLTQLVLTVACNVNNRLRSAKQRKELEEQEKNAVTATGVLQRYDKQFENLSVKSPLFYSNYYFYSVRDA